MRFEPLLHALKERFDFITALVVKDMEALPDTLIERANVYATTTQIMQPALVEDMQGHLAFQLFGVRASICRVAAPSIFSEQPQNAAHVRFHEGQQQLLQFFRRVLHCQVLQAVFKVGAKIEPVTTGVFDELPRVRPQVDEIAVLPQTVMVVRLAQQVVEPARCPPASQIQTIASCRQ